jgi:hypothetical protein
MEPYKDKEWLYHHYVQKRMNLKDIVKILKDSYNVSITVQGLYNWVDKYDLLKYRGKGRNLRAKSVGGKSIPKSPMQMRIEALKKQQRQAQKYKKRPQR